MNCQFSKEEWRLSPPELEGGALPPDAPPPTDFTAQHLMWQTWKNFSNSFSKSKL